MTLHAHCDMTSKPFFITRFKDLKQASSLGNCSNLVKLGTRSFSYRIHFLYSLSPPTDHKKGCIFVTDQIRDYSLLLYTGRDYGHFEELGSILGPIAEGSDWFPLIFVWHKNQLADY